MQNTPLHTRPPPPSPLLLSFPPRAHRGRRRSAPALPFLPSPTPRVGWRHRARAPWRHRAACPSREAERRLRGAASAWRRPRPLPSPPLFAPPPPPPPCPRSPPRPHAALRRRRRRQRGGPRGGGDRRAPWRAWTWTWTRSWCRSSAAWAPPTRTCWSASSSGSSASSSAPPAAPSSSTWPTGAGDWGGRPPVLEGGRDGTGRTDGTRREAAGPGAAEGKGGRPPARPAEAERLRWTSGGRRPSGGRAPSRAGGLSSPRSPPPRSASGDGRPVPPPAGPRRGEAVFVSGPPFPLPFPGVGDGGANRRGGVVCVCVWWGGSGSYHGSAEEERSGTGLRRHSGSPPVSSLGLWFCQFEELVGQRAAKLLKSD